MSPFAQAGEKHMLEELGQPELTLNNHDVRKNSVSLKVSVPIDFQIPSTISLHVLFHISRLALSERLRIIRHSIPKHNSTESG